MAWPDFNSVTCVGFPKSYLPAIADAIGKPVVEFAFPYGGEDAFDHESEVAVREAGYVLACRAVFGRVTQRTDPYKIPRAQVFDRDEQEFSADLDSWFKGRVP